MVTITESALVERGIETLDGHTLLQFDADAVATVRAGLDYAAFESLRDILGMTASEVAGLVGIPARTLARRRAEGRLSPDESDRLLRVACIVELACYVFEDEGAALKWLQTPHALLAQETPLQRADTGPGAREVERMLYTIEFSTAA